MSQEADQDISSSTDQDNDALGQDGALSVGGDRSSSSRYLVDEHVFQAFMGGVIALNTIAVAGETDHPEWPIWPVLDNVFLCIFLVELALRVWKKGVLEFLTSKKEKWWNVLDMLIVLLGAADLWLAPLVVHVMQSEAGHAQIAGGSGVLRFLRLLRLLRLLRVLKMFRRLTAFLEAMKTMLGPFFLVMIVLFGFNLCVSIGMTRILGRVEGDEADEVAVFFSDVQTSFFSLFQIITMDNWFVIAKPVIQMNGVWCLFFVLFIAFCSWTMISILTAVASDNVISATTGRQEKERHDREKKTKEFYRLLRAMFVESDEDGNGLLDKTEFQGMLQTDHLNQLLNNLEMHVKKEELSEMWDTIDVAGTGVLTIDEFVDGLAFLQEDRIMTRHVATLDYNIRRLSRDLEKRLRSLTRRVQEWRAQNSIFMDALEHEDWVQRQQNLALFFWLQWAVRKDPGSFPSNLQDLALRKAERRPPSLPARASTSPGRG
mmetsp:Transcript_108254/g.337358  ORF Transcript_108254/g.337358 Transcript_108254/m.337358 type:complete len:488 (-) Transcript_108254:343-1806(-)